jgi:ABC-type bacteriocin/lantibiotic exporter with double-glycine peptidase domain
LITIAVTAIILFNAKLFLLLLAILVPPVIAIFYFIRKRLQKVKADLRSSSQSSHRHLMDTLKGYAESNVYDRHDFFTQRYMNDRKRFGKSVFESVSIQNIPPRIIEIFAVLGLFILILIANRGGGADSSFLIIIGAFMAAAYKIIPGIVKIINISGQIRAHEFSLTDLVEKNELKHTAKTKKHSRDIESLQFSNICFQYDGQRILENLSFKLCRGHFIGIAGRSGIGKTTLLNIILGFLRPSKGEVLINNNQAGPEEIRNYWPDISYVRQQNFLIHDTIARNITLEEETVNPQQLKCAVRASGLNEVIGQFPEGLDHIITENGKNISGGQQQRIALARAFYKDADLILLDEPFSELDDASVISLLEHFRELASEGKMIVMITHDKQSLSYCNKVIRLDE